MFGTASDPGMFGVGADPAGDDPADADMLQNKPKHEPKLLTEDVDADDVFVLKNMRVRLFLYIRLWCSVSVFCLFSGGGAGRGCCAVAVGWARLGWAGMEWDGMD